MKRGRYETKRKPILFVTAMILLVCVAVGGTVAWLTATTGSVKNTFTVGNIKLSLSETGVTNGAKDYSVVPGSTYGKDAKVTVEKNSEKCYLFVHVKAENNSMTVGQNTEDIVKWTPADGWTAVTGHAGYYYRVVDKSTSAAQDFYVFKDNKVTINDNLVAPTASSAPVPALTITAAAVQFENVANVTAAWEKLPAAFKA